MSPRADGSLSRARKSAQIRKLECAAGWAGRLTGDKGSSVLTSMCEANALVGLPKGKDHIGPGERVRVLMLNWPSLW